MKKLVLIGLILALASPAFAALTAEEETFVSNLYTNKDKLIDLYNRSTELSAIADNLTSETIPLEIAKLRAQREDLIIARDAQKDAIKAQAIADMDAVDATYQPQIDAINSQISILEAQLDALLP